MVESHRGATIVVINVQGFPLFPGRGSGYIHVGLSLCDVIAASVFLCICIVIYFVPLVREKENLYCHLCVTPCFDARSLLMR